MKKSYYAIIPANVRYDDRLTDGAKLLYGEITALTNEKGYCWAGDSYFEELYKVSRATIQRWFKQLEINGYIKREVVYKKDTKSIEKRYVYLSDTYAQKRDNPMLKNETTPILKNETDNNTLINNTFNNNVHDEKFEEWWNLYDLKRDKKRCATRYKNLLKKYPHEKIMQGTKEYLDHLKDLKRRGEFVPQKRLPSTFLNNENFNDEFNIQKENTTPSQYKEWSGEY